jgi:hypothetical protein
MTKNNDDLPITNEELRELVFARLVYSFKVQGLSPKQAEERAKTLLEFYNYSIFAGRMGKKEEKEYHEGRQAFHDDKPSSRDKSVFWLRGYDYEQSWSKEEMEHQKKKAPERES